MSFRSVVYNIVQQVMLDLLRKEVICKTLNAHFAKFFNREAATYRPSRKILTLSSIMAPVVPFVRRSTDSAIADRGNVASKASKSEQVSTNEMYIDVMDSPQGRLE